MIFESKELEATVYIDKKLDDLQMLRTSTLLRLLSDLGVRDWKIIDDSRKEMISALISRYILGDAEKMEAEVVIKFPKIGITFNFSAKGRK